MQRLVLPILLAIVTFLLLLRTEQPQAALGFGVVTYGAVVFIRQGIAGIRRREIILPNRYGLSFHLRGDVAAARSLVQVGIGVVLLVFALSLGVMALAA